MEVENPKVKYSDDEVKSPRSSRWIFYPLFLLFGLGTWLNLNGIWIELPLLIPRLPEGWKLSAQLGMASNLANIGPLIIAVIRHFSGKSSAYEVPSIMFIFVVGIVVPFLLSFTWSDTLVVFGTRRSVSLLFFGFCLALVNCTSSVTYLPFVSRFPKKWLNYYFAGESLSSLIPALLGIIQGIDDQPSCSTPSPSSSTSVYSPSFPFTTTTTPPVEEERRLARFSVQVYLGILSVLMFCSFIAFLLLWRLQPKKKATSTSTEEQVQLKEKEGKNEREGEGEGGGVEDVETASTTSSKEQSFSRFSMVVLAIVFWTSILLIGCIPSINSYSLNPYGPMTFHYVLILCQCCYPFVSLVSTLFPKLFRVTRVTMIVSTTLGTLAFVYIFITAFRSPCSPFVDQPFGKYLIAFLWLFVYVVFYYERISLGNYLNETCGHRGLFWYGQLTQAGALIGATFIFSLTSFDTFEERDFCLQYQC